MATTKAQLAERADAQDRLRALLAPGDTVYTVLRHVSASGMTRHIGAVIMVDGAPMDMSGLVARAIGERFHPRNGGVVMGGCGMDMGFHLVYVLSRVLYPDGHPCVGVVRCPSNDHSNGDRNYGAHVHADGGYALRHRWL